ncbi:MAG: hypothetical protein D6722_07680, partial [Bacteroidetes bacterium]
CPLLILDEPAQSLDPHHRQFLYRLLRELAAEGRTILCSTHDLEVLDRPGSRIVGLREGELVWDGPSGQRPPDLLATVYGMEG